MNLLHELPLFDEAGRVRVVIEVPRGSALKLKYDDVLEVFSWSRALPLGVTYPYDFGFLPQTLAGDGDALDALVLAEVASFPGVVVPARVIGALRVEQMRDGEPAKRNDRIVTVPVKSHRWSGVVDIGDVAQRLLDEVQAFFAASLALTGKNVRFCGWADAAEAERLVAEAHRSYQAKQVHRGCSAP